MRSFPLALSSFPNAFDVPLSGSAWAEVESNKVVRVVPGGDYGRGCNVHFTLILWIITRT